MMKTTKSNQRGAVLVVTLIMLSMITFLVMAFVGFSRFERASVEASLVRTEAGHALEIGLVKAQREVMVGFGKGENLGLLVSQNQDGAGVDNMNGFTNQASLVDFATSLKDSPRVPVFIDRDGDGVQETFPFYLDLNNALNADGSRYQQSGTNNLGRFVGGDPHWIGLLQWPGQPHGPTNRFVARYAYLTVPAHKALNFRYHHNDLKSASANLDRYGRLQGVHPRELNLAAPLWALDPVNFPYENYNPYFGLTDPRFSSYPDPEQENSAFGYAAALSQFGHQIEDAMHLARFSKGYNELLSLNPGMASTHLRNLSSWLNSSNPSLGGGRLATPPYSYYQFMELFSSVPLPVEPEKFDVNGIRDEIVEGTAYINTSMSGLPSTFSGLPFLTFQVPHGLKSGDKLEWSGAPGGLSFPPKINDPITFDVITDDMTDAQRQDRLELLTQRIMHTTVPHHLVPGEKVQISLTGIDKGLTWLQSTKSYGYPYGPAPFIKTDMFLYSDVPNRPPQPIPTSEATKLILQSQAEIHSAYNMKTNWWGSWDGNKWEPKYRARPALADGTLPDEFMNARCTVTYRAEPRPLDLIPYFVKVIDDTTVTLHRSAQLDEDSKVILCYPRSLFRYSNNNSVFDGNVPKDVYAWLFRNGDSVRFVIPNNHDGSPGKIATASGAAITEQNTFMLNKFGTVPLQFTLPDPADPSSPLKMKDGFTYTLQVVPKNTYQNFRHDGLTAAMEKMAGLMLNESLDTTGDGRAGPLPDEADVHFLGGQPLQEEKDPARQLNPDPPEADPDVNIPLNPNPFPLKMGIGGHQKSLGPWHHPKNGIPWGRGSASTFLTGTGRYTREMDRIVQVAANIADLYSEPPANISTHPKMFGYPLFGKDLVRFSKVVKPRGMLKFGDIKSDSEISADIRQNSILSGGLSGLGLGEYFAYFKPDRSTFENQKVKGRVYLQIGITGAPVATSKELKLDVWGPLKSPVTWSWRMKTLWPRSGSKDEIEYWVGYNFRMTCEAGREVRVYFNDEEVLSYENSKRPNSGQTSLLSVGADAVFTNLKPWVELGMKKEMREKFGVPDQPGKAECFDFQKTKWEWYVDAVVPLGWSDRKPYIATPPNPLPTAYKGVFRRDEWNNVFLTGFQRKNLPLLTLFDSDSKPDPTGLLNSWYQRFAPTIIGVKDRSNIARPSPGHNMHAAITEVTLRVNFDRQSKQLYGRLGMEVYVPWAIGGASTTYTISARAGIVGGKYVLERTDSNGISTDRTSTPLNIVKDYRPFTTGTGLGNPSKTINLAPGRHTIIFGPNPDLLQNFFGMNLVDIPPANRFDPKTGFLSLSGQNPDTGQITEILLSDGKDSLTDIRIEDLQLAFEGEIRVGSNRPVDYINDTFKINGPVKFANPSPLNKEWTFIPTWKAGEKYGQIGGQNHPEVVIDHVVNAVYRLRPGVVVENAKDRPSSKPAKWLRLQKDLRKIEISWQANDPLVNSHASDFKVYDYSPPYLVVDKKGNVVPKTSPNAKTYRSWMPYYGHNKSVNFLKLPHVQSNHSWKLGVNLAFKNDASQPWTLANGGDSAIQDAGVGYSPLPHLDWRFPDISRGRIKNLGWLGQVHRGTPWQTLYLKSKVPGLIDNITAVNNGVVTAPNHNISPFDEVQLTGKCPPEWLLLNFAVNGGVDSAGNIKAGELQGYAEVLNANQFRIWGLKNPIFWQPGGDIVPDVNVADTKELMAQNIQYWKDWAGSLYTMPANDRRLLEVFSVGNGIPVRGRFSVNNDSYASWSAPLCGLSIPQWAIQLPGGQSKQQIRILGANDPDDFPDRDQRIKALDGGWRQIVAGINTARGPKVFTRVTDVLAAPQLSDDSPYLEVAFQYAPGFSDELDSERIPMQLLSLLRVDDHPIYETYIFTEKLRPALRLNLPMVKGSARAPDGTILNYEVAGQIVRRVIYELEGAQTWHRSLKNNHPGEWRDKDGNLQPLPPLRPKILHSSTLQMN